MIREQLKQLGFSFTDKEFEDVMEMATDDIKFNRVKFGKCTKFGQAVTIVKSCAQTLQKCI